RVTLGQESVAVTAAQADPVEEGVHLVRFVVPAGTPEGCYVPLRLHTGVRASNLTTLPVAASGPCPHRLRLTEAEMARLDAGEKIAVGELLLRVSHPAESSDIAQFLVRGADAELVAELSGVDGPVVTACSLSGDYANEDRAARQPLNRFYDLLRTGAVTGEGPGGEQISISAVNTAEGPPVRALAAGEWRLRVAGGAQVAPFEARFQAPAAWKPEVTGPVFGLGEGEAIEMRWDASGMENDVVTVALTEARRHRLMCEAPASGGVLRMEAGQLAGWPAGVHPDRLVLTVQGQAATLQPFRFPLADGGEGVGLVRVAVSEVTFSE
ncbi:MAG: hypothetical protein JNK48_21175, partial [Bryobacterales bacterium]|nr:hypothetical protein [Bryobacterales bacterium]